MLLVICESPYAGDVEANLAYARRCARDCILRGESPYASHLLLTQEGVLDDNIPVERELGIRSGFAWGQKADLVAIYIDKGISRGMRYGIEAAKARNSPIEIRALDRAVTSADYIATGLVDYPHLRIY